MLLQGSEMVKPDAFLLLFPFWNNWSEKHLFLSISYQVSAAEERLGPMRLTQEPVQVESCLVIVLQKFGVGNIFYVFDRSYLCSPRLHLFDQKYSKKSETLQFKMTIFYLNILSNWIYSCDAKLNLLHTILQKSFQYADLLFKKKSFLLSVLKTVALLNLYKLWYMCI